MSFRVRDMQITRRDLFGVTAAGLAAPARAAQRPNVLFIIVDDLNTDVGCYGLPEAKTPNIDRLASRGVRFDYAYCQYPLCNPSRTSFLSGLRPETTRVFDNKVVLHEKYPRVEFMPDFFRRHGYFVAGAGKIFHGEPKTGSFDAFDRTHSEEKGKTAVKRTPWEGGRPPNWWAVLDGPEELSADAIAARKIVAWIEQLAREGKPFFLAAGFQRPHRLWIVPKKYFDLYPRVSVRDEPPMRLIPPVALMTELGPSRPAEPKWQERAIAAYRAATSYMDAQTGKILAAMDRLKLWESTIVVLISDNGFHLGDHGLWSKHTLFERATRVPMIVSGPGVNAGKTCRRTTELLDIFPSLAELAGLRAPAALQGKSLVPLLRQPGTVWDRPARSVVEREDIFGRAVRTERWRYVEWNDGKQGSELYDHDRDPGEYVNLAADPAQANTVKNLRALLRG
ncbi:MAG: sulfatase [bacterium]|nr:sulfatase [bacterium]